MITTILDDTTALMVFKAAQGKKLIVSVEMNLSLIDYELKTDKLVFVSECKELNDIVAHTNCDIYDAYSQKKIATGRQIVRVLDTRPPLILNLLSSLTFALKKA